MIGEALEKDEDLEGRDILRYLGFELIGLQVRNEDWVPAAADRAARLFKTKPTKTAAVLMAISERGAIDYIEQSPALVVFAIHGNRMFLKKERAYLVSVFRKHLSAWPKLRDLNRVYGVAPQLRALKPKALRESTDEYLALKLLAHVPPSTLAQIIPTSIPKQRLWIAAMTAWLRRCLNHSIPPSTNFVWMSAAVSRAISQREFSISGVGTVADFAVHRHENGLPWNDRWTWQGAFAAERVWTSALNREKSEKAFLHQHGLGWDEEISFGALPTELAIDGISIVALNSGAKLFEEGSAMRHCVASYADRVIKGRCRIYSLRDGERRLATAEFMPRTNAIGATSYELVQIEGPCRARVSHQIMAMAVQFGASLGALELRGQGRQDSSSTEWVI